MISNMELNFVGSIPKNIPFPGEKYASKVIDKLIEACKIYEKQYKDKRYSIILSNGEEIRFSIDSSNLCHLLGIDYQYIASDEMAVAREFVLDYELYSNFSSYDLLQKIIKKSDEIIKNDSNYCNQKLLNYYRIFIKCLVFSELGDFLSFNFGCINFDKYIYQESAGKDYKPNSTKILFMRSQENLVPYFMIGLIPDNNSERYSPETVFAARDFYNFFVNQELLIPIYLLVSDKKNLSKISATSSDKLYLLRMYRSIIEHYQTNSYINIFNDYENMIANDALKEKKLGSRI